MWKVAAYHFGNCQFAWQFPAASGLENAIHPDEFQVLACIMQALPVVNDRREKRVVGLVRRSDLASAYLRLLYGRPRGESAAARLPKT